MRPLLLVLCACGRVAFEPYDARLSDGVSDVGDALPPIDPATPWGTPGPLVTVDGQLTFPFANPSSSDARLELYYDDGVDIFRRTRAQASELWGPQQTVPELDTPSRNIVPELSPDGLTLFLASDRSGDFELYIATRSSPSAMWSTPALIPELSEPDFDRPGCVTSDALVLSLDSRRSGPQFLYDAQRASTASPFNLTNFGSLTTGEDGEPCISGDGLALYFASTASGIDDLYLATRSSRSQPFASSTAISELNTGVAEQQPWVSSDGHHLIFMRGGVVYEATR